MRLANGVMLETRGGGHLTDTGSLGKKEKGFKLRDKLFPDFINWNIWAQEATR